jgi:replicative DNA helicase
MINKENIYPSHAMVEKTILAIFIRNSKTLYTYVLRIKPEYFHVEEFGLIYQLMLELVKENAPIDEPILINYLKELQPERDWPKEFEEIKIWGEFDDKLDTFVNKLEDNFVNRKFVEIALMISDLGISEQKRINSSVQQLLDLKKLISHKTEEPLSKLMLEFMKTGGFQEKEAMVGSGIKMLDKLMGGGFEKKQLLVIGSRPGMGKTAFLMSMCNSIIDEGNKRVLYISLSLNPKHFLTLMLANRLNYSLTKIYAGEFPDNYNTACNSLLEAENNGFFKYHFQTDNDFMNLMAEINNHRMRYGLDVVIIDNLQMMDESNPVFYQNRNNTLGKNLRRMKQLAQELNFLLVVGSELSRNAERRSSSSTRPMLHDLKDSGWIEELADKVILIYRPDYYDLVEWEDGESTKGQGELIVCKNNFGLLENLRVNYNEESRRFSNLLQPEFVQREYFEIPLSRKDEF